MLGRLLLLAFIAWAVFSMVFGLVHAAFAHDGVHDKWFAAQRVPQGAPGAGMSCCDHSDGHILEEDQWRIADGHYEFLYKGQWIAIEDARVLPYDGGNPSDPDAEGNPIGKPVVWYITYGDDLHIYCFKAGTET